jgi:uncharacterized protein YqjF (DUF2071 family)
MTESIRQPSRFLTAGWYHLVMLNYPVDPAALRARVPAGTEIDFWNGQTYLSVVGFQFRDTRVFGLPIPWHRNFPEVNLRFYVRHRAADGWRRGVVFIKEIVPRWMVSWVARTLYNESYVTLPMREEIRPPMGAAPGVVGYEWCQNGRWLGAHAEIAGEPQPLTAGSEAEFITEHYWGYVRQRDGSTVEYQVEHPAWRVWPARSARLNGDVADFYGGDFAAFRREPPASAFVAEGSPIVVRRGRVLGAAFVPVSQ